jgi:hypothetical protein
VPRRFHCATQIFPQDLSLLDGRFSFRSTKGGRTSPSHAPAQARERETSPRPFRESQSAPLFPRSPRLRRRRGNRRADEGTSGDTAPGKIEFRPRRSEQKWDSGKGASESGQIFPTGEGRRTGVGLARYPCLFCRRRSA